MYDPLTNKWKYMREMNECRSAAAAVVVNGKIFCSHGKNENYYNLDSIECYELSSDVWTLICNMPQKLCGHGAVEMNGNFIVIGGTDGKEEFKSVWALDTTDKNAEWIEKPSMSIPRIRFSIAKIDHEVYVCGGRDRSMEIFDGEVWRNGSTIPADLCNVPAVAIPMRFAKKLK